MFRSSSPHYVRCTVQIEDVANLIICDQRKVSEADSERFAVAEGWLVDYSVNPHTHVCPECRDAAGQRPRCSRWLSRWQAAGT